MKKGINTYAALVNGQQPCCTVVASAPFFMPAMPMFMR